MESGGLGLLDNRTPPGNVGTMLESEIGSFPPKMKARGVKSHQWIENLGGVDCVYICGGGSRSECLLHVFFSCSVLQFLRQSLSYCLNCSSLLVH